MFDPDLWGLVEDWLRRMNLIQLASKHTLATIFDRFNDELKSQLNSAYLFLGNDG